MDAVVPPEDIVELLRQVTGEDREWCAGVGATTRLDGDLFLDSIELAALSGLLVQRYGPPADLAAFVAGLELEQLIALTIGDVADFVVGSDVGDSVVRGDVGDSVVRGNVADFVVRGTGL